jgi:hypothetical protein
MAPLPYPRVSGHERYWSQALQLRFPDYGRERMVERIDRVLLSRPETPDKDIAVTVGSDLNRATWNVGEDPEKVAATLPPYNAVVRRRVYLELPRTCYEHYEERPALIPKFAALGLNKPNRRTALFREEVWEQLEFKGRGFGRAQAKGLAAHRKTSHAPTRRLMTPLGHWGTLPQPRGRTAFLAGLTKPQMARFEGLDEILAEVDGSPVPECDREYLTDELREMLEEIIAERVTAAAPDAGAALPREEALNYTRRMLERSSELTREERFAVGLQLSNVLRGARRRARLGQIEAAEICGISERSLRSIEDVHEDRHVLSKTTLRKIYAGLSHFPEVSPDKPARDLKWEWNVDRGREIVEHYLTALYQEWFNFAYRDVKVRRKGYLWDVARYKRGNWEDQAQEGFLRIWADAGFKHPGDEDKRKKHDPVDFLEGYEREWDDPPRPWPNPEEDPRFEAWARRRANVGVSTERREEYKRGDWETLLGEEGLLDALRENVRPGEPDHETPFRKGGLVEEAENHYSRPVVVCYASPERQARIGETSELYPIRRRLLPAPLPPTKRPEPPDWVEEKRDWRGNEKDWTSADLKEYERRYYSHDWQRPDDWETLGSYPVSKPLLDNVIWPAKHYCLTKTGEEWAAAQKPIDQGKRRDFLKIYKSGQRLENVREGRPSNAAWKMMLEELEDPKGMHQGVALEESEDDGNLEKQ